MQKPRVVYWNNIPAPYMVERFNALIDRGNLDFEAWFNNRRESNRNWEIDESTWNFQYRYLPFLQIGKMKVHFPLPLLKGPAPEILISLYAKPVFVIGWFIAKFRSTKTAFWCQVTNDRWVKRHSFKNFVKRIIFSRANATFGSGEESRAFAIQFGTPPKRALYLRHSIDVVHYRKGSNNERLNRDEIRKNLKLRGTTFIYVGRLWWGKGIKYLLEAFCELQKRNDIEMSLLLVGDGPDENMLKIMCKNENIKNVVFAGFHQKLDLPRFYAASDVFVFPTLGDPYGLVVDEAMACSLPVISTSAAGEIGDRIVNKVNGYIVPPENSLALADRMEKLAHDAELRKKMGKISVRKIAGQTPENWAKNFEKAVFMILNRKQEVT